MSLKNELKHLLFKMPRCFTRLFYLIYNYLEFPECREIKKTYGELNPDITFYIIRPRPGNVEGLMALFLDVMKQLDYADKRKYVPVVDFQKYETQYFENGKNAWEIYFKQVSNYSLDEVYKSKNVILSGLNALEKAPSYLNQKFDDESLQIVRKLVRKYIRISDSIQAIVEKEDKKLKVNDCIGLYLRGTDYIKMKPAGHPVQPSPEQAIEKIDELLANNNRHIFLVTEDNEIREKIVGYYGNKIKTVTDDIFITNYDGNDFLSMTSSINELGSKASERGIIYLVKLYLLARCRYMIAGNTSGSWAASVLSGKLDMNSMYIFDLGIY